MSSISRLSGFLFLRAFNFLIFINLIQVEHGRGQEKKSVCIRGAFLDFYNQPGINRGVRVGVFNLEMDVIAGERLPITRAPLRCCHQRE